jgi:hypothetical protein
MSQGRVNHMQEMIVVKKRQREEKDQMMNRKYVREE